MPHSDPSGDRDHWPAVKVPHAADELLVLAVDLGAVTVQPALLDDRERERGRRLRSTELRHHYLAAHTALRQILGWQLARDPAGLVFAIDPRGKPSLPDAQEVFTLSHSGAHALIALASEGAVGVDLECGERLDEVGQLATRVFATSELTRFQARPAAEQRSAFLTAWTRKEAALKALGVGLPGGMEHVVIADHPLRLLGDFAALPGLRTLRLVDLPELPGYAAALCHGPWPLSVRCCRWPDAATRDANGELPTAGTT